MDSILGQKILKILKDNPFGIKASEIAHKLNVTRKEVNQFLTYHQDEYVKTDDFRWVKKSKELKREDAMFKKIIAMYKKKKSKTTEIKVEKKSVEKPYAPKGIISKETSERSKNYNIAEKKIKTLNEFVQVEFEGVSTRNNVITCLLDRGVTNLTIDEFLKEDALAEIKYSEKHFDKKLRIASKIGVPWLYVIYSYIDKKCVVYDLTSSKNTVTKYNSFNEFGEWFSQYTDATRRFSSYQESGLPQFDYELRKNGTPWPGNIDGILLDSKTEKIMCIIEYQNTSATTVRLHDNNKYIKPTAYRKGDNKRWMVQERLSDALEVKVIVVVWSLQEDIIGLKLIDSFDLDNNGLVSYINWGKKNFIPVQSLVYSDIINISR